MTRLGQVGKMTDPLIQAVIYGCHGPAESVLDSDTEVKAR
jgi:hypothetical protein